MKFRKDINGLRAFAVIAVVLFHFNASWMPGGFAGVDVFFVISGFLMTGIIFKGLENNNFSVLNFYVARANRIIPALAALCLALIVFGWFYLTPLEYKALGKHAASSVGFLSNVTYWREAGYFDAASHEKWLLHTWSLSVEWQFYIIYPLVLLALKRIFSLKILKSLIIVATVIGFIFSVYATYKWPSASYYLFPMRAWEMMLGGVAFLYPLKLHEGNKKLVEALGLVLILGSYIFITGDDPWPGYLALFPVLGTFLVIQAQRNESIITGNIIFQKLGAWSYSIYLWHWPFVVAIYTFSLPDKYIYIGMALSVLLGYLSYKYIERIKFPRSFPKLLDYLKCKPIYIACLVGILGSILFLKSDQLSEVRFSSQQNAVFKTMYTKQYECFNKPYQHEIDTKFCTLTSGNKKLLAFGDSHSNALLPVIEDIALDKKLELSYTGYNGCIPLINTNLYRSDQEEKSCAELNNKVHKSIMSGSFDYVILASRWTYYTDGDYNHSKIQYIFDDLNKEISHENSIRVFKSSIKRTFEDYSKSNADIFIMLQVPMQKKMPERIYLLSSSKVNFNNKLLEHNSISKLEHIKFQKLTNDIIKEAAQQYDNITVIDPTSTMCIDDKCLIGNNIYSYYSDDDHLSTKGSFTLKNLLTEKIFE